MLGSKPRMPKRARYPLFLAGLAAIVLGGLALMRYGSPEPATAVTVAVGLLLMVGAVIFK